MMKYIQSRQHEQIPLFLKQLERKLALSHSPVPNHLLDQEARGGLVYPRHPGFQRVSLDVDGDHLDVEEVSQA